MLRVWLGVFVVVPDRGGLTEFDTVAVLFTDLEVEIVADNEGLLLGKVDADKVTVCVFVLVCVVVAVPVVVILDVLDNILLEVLVTDIVEVLELVGLHVIVLDRLVCGEDDIDDIVSVFVFVALCEFAAVKDSDDDECGLLETDTDFVSEYVMLAFPDKL